MKKIIMLWLFAIISIVGIAQNTTEHLSYMGIPITGTITQFQAKLQAKRCSLDKQTSNSLGVGCRASNGKGRHGKFGYDFEVVESYEL